MIDQQLTMALVTGATSGLGKAIAFELAKDGMFVIVHGRDADRGAEVVHTIEASGGHARFVRADLADPQAIRALAADVGELDVLVNNAGFSWFGPSAELDAAGFDALFAANVRAPYLLVSAFAPGMAARGRGSIVNVGSMVGAIGLPTAAAYGATKAALSALTRSWAAELGSRGVRVNTVAPGPVYTEGAKRERTAALGATTPLQRAADADEIARVVAFVASNRASYVTGTTIAADGGRSAT